MEQRIEVETLHLFGILDKMLIELLTSLTEEEWQIQTIAKRWKVKDVASHLLDGNLRGLSISRDGYFGEKAGNIHSYQDLVAYLNHLNLMWTDAAKRLSPQVLISLLELTGQQYTAHLHTLDPFKNAVFSVAWAGQETSYNWFHIAREYTEKFLHQQQIRDAVGKQGQMTPTLFYPFLDTFLYALPVAFKEVSASVGTIVSVIVTTEAGGQWNIVKTETGWQRDKVQHLTANATLKIDPDTAWKLFSKSLRPEHVSGNVDITGEERLGLHALQMVSVMA